MSFRNTFITDFIYQASDEVKDANEQLLKVFENYTTHIVSEIDSRGYGYFAGTIGTSGGSLYEGQLDELSVELSKVTKVPFRLVVLMESNAMLCFNIEQRQG